MNSTDGNSIGPFEQDRQPFAIFTQIVMALTIILIVVLNPLSLAVLRRANGLSEASKVFMMSLTVSDICIGLFWAVPQLAAFVARTWALGNFLCRVFGTVIPTLTTLSILSLLLLTIDRFVAIVYALRYPSLMTPLRAKVTVAVMWTLTVTVNVIFFGIYAPATVVLDRDCVITPCDFCIGVVATIFGLSLLNILVLYLVILRVVRRHERLIAALNHIAGDLQGPNAPQPIGTKSATTLLIITGAVCVCWTPQILLPVIFFDRISNYNSFSILTNTIFFTNSWLNVVIYYLRNRELRHALHELVASCFRL